MYNRYIPQSDGSYRRSRVQEQPSPEPVTHRQSEYIPPQQEAPAVEQTPPPPPRPNKAPNRAPKHEPQSGNVMGFLRQLLPQNFDTGDLMVVLLLLLMSENDRDGQNTALLTLVIYLFL